MAPRAPKPGVPSSLQELTGARIAVLPEGVPAPRGSAVVNSSDLYAFGVLTEQLEPIHVSGHFERLFGAPAELYPKQPGGFLPQLEPESRAQVELGLRDLSSEALNVQVQVSGTPEGEERWLSLYCGFTYLEDGFRGIAWWANDISEFKRREREAALESESYRAIMKRARDGITITDLELRVLDANQAFCEIVGRPVDDVRGRPMRDFLPPEDAAAARVPSLRPQDTRRGERRVLRPDGSICIVEFTANELSDGRLMAITRDVTESRLAARMLRDSEERHRRISEMVSDYAASIRVMPDGRVEREWMTDAFQRMTGFHPDEVDTEGYLLERASLEAGRRSPPHIVHPDDLEQVERRMRLLITGPWNEGHEEFRIVTKSGEIRWVAQRARRVPVPEEEGGGSRIFLVVQDVTAQRVIEDQRRRYAEHLELEVRERTRELEQRNRELRELQSKLLRAERLGAAEELAGSVAHSINNPLGALIGTAQMSLETQPDSRPELERILKLAQRIRSVVARTLQIYREGELKVRPEDPGDVMRDVADELTERASAAQVKIVLRVEGVRTSVHVDRAMLSTALVGLAENAIEAMPAGGELLLEVRQLPELEVIEFRVCDRGSGIPEGDDERIFEPFFTTKGTGAGLGLAIARGLIAGHEGRLRMEARPGGGTIAIAELPCRPAGESLVAR